MTSQIGKDLVRRLTQLSPITSSSHQQWKNKTYQEVYNAYENIIKTLIEYLFRSSSNKNKTIQDLHDFCKLVESKNFNPQSLPCLKLKYEYYNKFGRYCEGCKALEVNRIDLKNILYGIWCEKGNTGDSIQFAEANQAGDASVVTSENRNLDMLKKVSSYCLKGKYQSSTKQGGKLTSSSSSLVNVNPFHYENAIVR